MRLSFLLLICILLLPAIGPRAISAQEQQGDAESVDTESPEDLSGAELQHKINLEALLNGSTMQIRMDAASVMFTSDYSQDHESLVEVLSEPGHTEAKQAICRMLVQQARAGRNIVHKHILSEPLLELLHSREPGIAEAAAEALLIYPYDQAGAQLERMARDEDLDVHVRINAIEALKYQPDMQAVFALLNLVDVESSQVSDKAAQTLRSLDIPVGADAQERQEISEQIRAQGRDEFLRAWKLRREMEQRVQSLENERDMWRRLYLESLDEVYRGISGESARADYLGRHLRSAQAVVRMWALGKVSEWRMGTDAKMPSELGSKLVGLVSDPSSDIRLKTAELLAVMGEVDSAQALLAQLEKEQDSRVAVELFGALGQACYYSFLTDSTTEISEDVRAKALEWAERFLNADDSQTVQRSADVIRKLLEHNGLEDQQAGRYMRLLAERYGRISTGSGSSLLRSELLMVMARLCRQSFYSSDAIEIFEPVLLSAADDENQIVRESAIEGIISIDRPKGLSIFRQSVVNEPSQSIRLRAIELASEVGQGQDIDWLSELLVSGSHGQRAWEAMLGIFRRSPSGLCGRWLEKFEQERFADVLTAEQMTAFLDVAERRAVSEDAQQLIWDTRNRLSHVLAQQGQYSRAIEYVGMLRESSDDPQQRQRLLGRLIELNLRIPDAQAVGRLVTNRLLEDDLGPESKIVQVLDTYFNGSDIGQDTRTILEILADIEVAEDDRPQWASHVQRWSGLLGDGQH